MIRLVSATIAFASLFCKFEGLSGKGRIAAVMTAGELDGSAMAFKVGDVVRLKFGGTLMTVSKLFKSLEGREMVQCTWLDKKPREHRAAFVIDSLEAAEQATLHTKRRGRLTD